MARTGKPNCKTCRKYGEKLYLKGRRCESDKCPVDLRRSKARRFRMRKLSEYGLQLREKNKVKNYYGVREKQFRRYFNLAKKKKGVTGALLLELLERRLDNVVYKLNWAYSRRMARQLVSQGAVLVNGRRVDRPGYVVQIGAEIQGKPKHRYLPVMKQCVEDQKDRPLPGWLEMNAEEVKARVSRAPGRDEVSIPVAEQLIVNLYSK